jgi:hypothetical protein
MPSTQANEDTTFYITLAVVSVICGGAVAATVYQNHYKSDYSASNSKYHFPPIRFRPGDEVAVLPSGLRATVKWVEDARLAPPGIQDVSVLVDGEDKLRKVRNGKLILNRWGSYQQTPPKPDPSDYINDGSALVHPNEIRARHALGIGPPPPPPDPAHSAMFNAWGEYYGNKPKS